MGYVDNGEDCNDNDANINPSASEICDGLDNDCDGSIDDGLDSDGDGYLICAGDCNDEDPKINIDAAEVCNGVDDDCDGLIDEAGAEGCSVYYRDIDDDTYGVDDGSSHYLCSPQGVYRASQGGDPDDSNADIIPVEDINIDMELSKGWSMISLPVIPNNARSSSLLPDAVVVYGYKKGTGYDRISAEENLEAGKGYWVFLNGAKNYTLTGQPIQFYTHMINENGWNMIGGCTSDAKASGYNCNISVIYGYEQGSGYKRIQEGESLKSEKGYWMLSEGVTTPAILTVQETDK